MKLVRFGPPGKEKPGLIDADGNLRDLSRKVRDIDGLALAPPNLKELAKLDARKLPLVKGRPRLGPCVATPSKFVAIGLNFTDHAKETNSPIPEYPIVFFKSTTCIVGAYDNVMVPKDSTQLDWEVELALVIGRTARYVPVAQALKYVAGYCIVNDVSERDFQLKKSARSGTRQGLRHVRADGSLARHDRRDTRPAEPRHVARRERRAAPDGKHPDDDLRRCHARRRRLEIHDAPSGDVITTGTPPGVGLGMKPQVWLKPGDVMTLGIAGLGEQRQKVVRSRAHVRGLQTSRRRT
jgi:2-keto-4-pentenoate hydratase/2-oxohepta-3-ene-1,7-dioic acid hydratase in catechol pathway